MGPDLDDMARRGGLAMRRRAVYAAVRAEAIVVKEKAERSEARESEGDTHREGAR